MDAFTPATACIAAPEWFWFGLLLLLWFTLPVAPSQSTLSTLTCLGHHNILIINLFYIENYFRGIILLNLKVNIILIVFSLAKLLIKNNIYIKTKNIGNIFQLK